MNEYEKMMSMPSPRENKSEKRQHNDDMNYAAVMCMSAEQFFASEERHEQYDQFYRSKELVLEAELIDEGVLE